MRLSTFKAMNFSSQSSKTGTPNNPFGGLVSKPRVTDNSEAFRKASEAHAAGTARAQQSYERAAALDAQNAQNRPKGVGPTGTPGTGKPPSASLYNHNPIQSLIDANPTFFDHGYM